MEITPELSPGAAKQKGPAPGVPTGALLASRYAVDAFVGATPLGEVYRATDRSDGKTVWVKLLSRELLADPAARARIEEDVAVAAQLDQKNIVTCYGLCSEGDNLFLVTEAVEGTTLRQMLEKKSKSGRAFSVKGAFNVVTHVCNALEYAHGGLLHGLLSGDTILVNGAGRVKIGDFGLARSFAPQERFHGLLPPSSLACLAPELLANPDDASFRADIYSVGALLFELLTGQSTAGAAGTASQLTQGVPKAIDAVIERCLQASPEARFADAHELKLAIHAATEEAITAAEAKAPPPPPPSRPITAPGPPLPAPSVSGSGPPLPGRASTPPRVVPSPPGSAVGGPGARARLPGLGASVVDETRERWLIQKDKLDFGPFRLAEVKRQIETGQIRGEHSILDMETGERRRVADHPLLRELAQSAQLRHDADREAEAAHSAAKTRSRRTMIVLAAVGVVIAAAGTAVTVLVLRGQGEKIVYRDRVRDRDSEDDLHGIEITMKVDPPAPKADPKHHHSGKASKNGTFDDTTNFGDATEGGGDETLGQDVVQKVMVANFNVLKGCVLEERSRNHALKNVEMDFIIKGTGLVSAVKVNGDTASPFASCMYAKMQSVSFPKFNGSKTHASFSLALK